ncbi:MAG: hypothetical protein JXA09_10345 [Anaerolineae bacterium]|nr:hypothetical protein [Anaerolineae bacterium]
MYGMSPQMLSRMYVAGSLQNQGDGFVFSVKNTIDSGAVSGLAKIAVDDQEIALDGVTVQMGERTRAVSDISWSNSLYVPYGATLTFFCPGALEAGEHTITLHVNAPELGRVSIPITDTIG